MGERAGERKKNGSCGEEIGKANKASFHIVKLNDDDILFSMRLFFMFDFFWSQMYYMNMYNILSFHFRVCRFAGEHV